jgi:hypothetical protein
MRATVVLLAGVCLFHSPTAFGQNADRFLGNWQSTRTVSKGIHEQIGIKRDAQGWHVDSIFLKNGETVGSIDGANVKLVDGNLVFHRKAVKLPTPKWVVGDNSFGLRFVGDELELVDVDANNRRIRLYKRVSDPAVAVTNPKADSVDPKAKADPKADPFVGIWKGPYPGSDKILLLKIAGSDAAGYSVEGIALGANGSVIGRFPTTDADRKPNSIQVDAGWDAFAGATFSGGVRIALDRNGNGLGLAVGNNRSALTATEIAEFTKLRAR